MNDQIEKLRAEIEADKLKIANAQINLDYEKKLLKLKQNQLELLIGLAL